MQNEKTYCCRHWLINAWGTCWREANALTITARHAAEGIAAVKGQDSQEVLGTETYQTAIRILTIHPVEQDPGAVFSDVYI